MSSIEDPQRLSEEAIGSDADRELRLGLGRLAGRLPGDARLARMAVAVGLEPPAPEAPPTAEPTAAASVTPAMGVVGGVGAAGAILLALWALQTPGASPQKTDAHRAIASASASASATASASAAVDVREAARKKAPGALAMPLLERPVATASTDAAATPTEAPRPLPSAPLVVDEAIPSDAVGADRTPRERKPSRSPAAAPASSAAAAGARPPAPIGITETQILRDARLILDRDPRSALALSEQHRRDYPNGSFAQERELIAITALVKLGRSSEASARAARFRVVYPASPYRARLDRIAP